MIEAAGATPADGVPTVDVRLFGAPAVQCRGVDVRFRSRKVLALFLYLATTGAAHTREHLIGLLWPESDRDRGRASLRSALRSLEQALPFNEAALTREQELVALSPTVQVRLDVDIIRRAAAGDGKAVAEALETQFRPFLEGFSLADADTFDHWTDTQRRNHHRELDLIYRTRCNDLATDPGRVDELLQVANRWAAAAPTEEAAYRAQMRAYALTGDTSAAADVFQQCRATLHSELGVDVAAETQQLHDTIQSHATTRSALPHVTDSTVAPSPPGPVLPMAGRRHDHLRLESALRLARQRTTNVVAVSGAAGIGKTRLVEQFLDRILLEDDQTLVLTDRTFEFGGQVPYQAPLGALRDHLATINAPDDLLEDVWLSELSRLMPELNDRYPDLAPPASGEPDFERSRWFEAVAQLGRALATERPVIIFLDDLHWADSGSFDLLHYLVTRWQEWRLPLTLIAAFRTEHLTTGQPASSWLRRLERDTPLVRCQLEALDRDAIVEIVTWLDDGSATELEQQRLVDWLETNTGGHPFFVVEMVRALLSQAGQALPNYRSAHSTNLGQVVGSIDDQGRPPLPATVRETIEARLESVSAAAADVLLAAATLGRPAQPQELAAIAGSDEAAMIEPIEDLIRAELLNEAADELAPYTCSHDLVREVAHDAAGEARRRLWHRRALKLLASSPAAPAARLAFHAISARDDAAALAYSLAAGESALDAFAAEDAVEHFSAVEAFARSVAPDGDDSLFRLLERRGAALELANRHQEALDGYTEMQVLAQRQGNDGMELRAIVAQALIRSLPTRLHNPAAGRKLSRLALEKARSLGDREREARALWCLLLADLHDVADKDQAWRNGSDGVAIAEELGADSLRAYILNDLHKLAMMQGNTEAALATVEQAIEHWQEVGNIPMLMDSYSNLSFLYCNVGKLDAALDLTDRCVGHAQELDNDWHLMNAPPSSVWAHREFGNYGRAIEILEDSLARTEPFGEIYVVNYSFSLALLYCDLGAFDRMRALCAVADQPAVHEGYAGFVNLAAGFRSLIDREGLARGREVAAPDLDAVTNQVLEASFFYPSTPFSWMTAVEAGLAHGQLAPAVELAKTIVATLQRFGINLMLPDAHLTLARGHARLGDWDAALAAAKSAAELARAIGSSRPRWQAEALSADLYDQVGQPGKAEADRAAARETVSTLLTRIPADLRAGFEATPLVAGLMRA